MMMKSLLQYINIYTWCALPRKSLTHKSSRKEKKMIIIIKNLHCAYIRLLGSVTLTTLILPHDSQKSVSLLSGNCELSLTCIFVHVVQYTIEINAAVQLYGLYFLFS